MNNTKTTIVMIGLIMVIAGTTLAPIQSYATRSGGLPDTSSLKHGIRDGVTVNLEHRDQHMNQENLCYRDNTCRQSDVGQNTLGNDNSITGFADQSDNIPQAAASTPTPSNQTTGNQTGGGGGGGTTNCVSLTISGLIGGSANQTADVGVCLIPSVITLVDIPGLGPTLVVLSTDGCPTNIGFVDTQITVGRFHLCAQLGLIGGR
jgi:hypothetical protein